MSAGDEKLREMIDRHLDSDNDPSALPPAECRDVCSECLNVYCVAEPVYSTEDDEEEKGEEE